MQSGGGVQGYSLSGSATGGEEERAVGYTECGTNWDVRTTDGKNLTG